MSEKSEQEHKYTSTGIKFWRHPEAMNKFRQGFPSVLCTHISPEGACNLKCSYCSVTYRKVSNRLNIDTIKDYVLQLKRVGLKSVILTGGGEPTIYPHFNELVEWLKVDQGLDIGLITNGTQARRVSHQIWRHFSWIRISINIFDGWEDKIIIPRRLVNSDAVVGSSFVFTVDHENLTDIDAALLKRVAKVARYNGAQYVRLLPNCLLPQTDLIESHAWLSKAIRELDDDIFFHQRKLHGAPQCSSCHQSRFRPYLSEVPYQGSSEPGSVYPCDSVVLNDEVAQFVDKYQLCAPGDVGAYMRGEKEQQFDASTDCQGCVFTDTVNMLDDYKHRGIERFDEFTDPLKHEGFV